MRYVLLSALLLTTTNCASVPGPAPAQEPSVVEFKGTGGQAWAEVRSPHAVQIVKVPEVR